MRLDMRWRTEAAHLFGGIHLCPTVYADQLLFSYSDRNLDCGLCGPRRRKRLVDQMVGALVSDHLYLTLDRSTGKKNRNTMTRFIRRKQGCAVTVPGSRWRMVLSTVKPTVDESRSTVECDAERLREIAEWVVSLWVSDRWQVSSTPTSLLKAETYSTASRKYNKGDTFGRPGNLISHLLEDGYGNWQEGPITGIPSLDEEAVRAVLKRHADGEFDHLEPYELDVLEGGIG